MATKKKTTKKKTAKKKTAKEIAKERRKTMKKTKKKSVPKGAVNKKSKKAPKDVSTDAVMAEFRQKDETKVYRKHAAILRERLAWVCRYTDPKIQSQIKLTLAAYAKAIEPYCECPERVLIQSEGKLACLDCGKRFVPEKE